MRPIHLACLTSVVIVMVVPPVRPRADEPAGPPATRMDVKVLPQRRLRTSKVDRALDAALSRAEQGVETGTAAGGRSAVMLGGTATSSSAAAAENHPRDPAFEAPMWGDPSGVELGVAVSAVRTVVARSKKPDQAAAPVSDK